MTRADALARDAADPLAHLRDRFVLPDGIIYLDGNSLGALPVGVADQVARVAKQQWGVDLIRSWNKHGWMDAPLRVGDRIGRLIGARPGEVVAVDSTSVNLYKVLVAAIRLRPGRTVIVTEVGNFPSDRYLISSVAEQLGLTVRVAEDVVAAMDDDVAVVSLTHVDYRTGRMHDMAAVTDGAHRVGAFMLWDLAHSAGWADVQLSDLKVDFAVGCGYKFLNGGPGAPAFVYVNEALHADFTQPLTGWLGHAEPFAMTDDFRPATGIARAIVGTPNMLSMAALEAALDAYDGVSLRALHTRSNALTDYMIALADELLPELMVATPRSSAHRGSQVSFRHPHGFEIVQALIARGVIGDFRQPDIVRFGLAPMYNSFTEVWDAVAHLADVLHTESWKDPVYAIRGAVT